MLNAEVENENTKNICYFGLMSSGFAQKHNYSWDKPMNNNHLTTAPPTKLIN